MNVIFYRQPTRWYDYVTERIFGRQYWDDKGNKWRERRYE